MSFNPSVTGQPVIVYDEGITLTSAVTSLNFVGAGVTATAVGNDVTVTVAGGGGSGTVTSVSVVTANGVSGSVATATTTPAITLTLGAITPTSVNGLTVTTTTGTLTVTNGKTLSVSDTTTLATNSITFAGTEVLTLAATKNVTFADAFITSGANSITLTSTGATNVTLPTSGTLATTDTSTFTPTVTLVGGAGNTVPVYSTNVGRYQRIGNRVFVTVVLSGDGGAEGAGTGVFTVDLPVAVSASITAIKLTSVGNYANSTTLSQLNGTISPSGTTISLVKVTTATAQSDLTGADQNNATRSVNLSFSYEV